MPETRESEALRLLYEAKARFCPDPVKLRNQDCSTCSYGAGDDERKPCPLRMEEVSALQKQFNLMAADNSEGYANWKAEYQNDPPPPVTASVVKIGRMNVIESRSGFLQGVVPEDAEILVQGRDVGRHEIYTVVMAVSPGRVHRIVDYYTEPVMSPHGVVDLSTAEGREKQHQIEGALWAALTGLGTRDAQGIYKRAGEKPEPFSTTLSVYDSRYATHVLHQYCYSMGARHVPAMGMGTTEKKPWSLPRDASKGTHRIKKHTDQVFVTADGQCYSRCNAIMVPGEKRRKLLWCYYAHADWYKSYLHSGFLLGAGHPGSISLFDPVDQSGEILPPALISKFHTRYANHITAEHEETLKNGMTQWVKTKGRYANHYLDATYLCLVAVSIIEHIFPDIKEAAELTPTTEAPTEKEDDGVSGVDQRRPWMAKKAEEAEDRPRRSRGTWGKRRKRRDR